MKKFVATLFIFVITLIFVGCGKQIDSPPVIPVWYQYYEDAIEILGNYPHTFQVVNSYQDITEGWVKDTSEEDWEGIKGITRTTGYGPELSEKLYWAPPEFAHFIHVLECKVYIFVPDAETIFHELVHMWDSHHYEINLTELETSYLTYKLLLYKDYILEAARFYENNILRKDDYSFEHLPKDTIEYVKDIYNLILGLY